MFWKRQEMIEEYDMEQLSLFSQEADRIAPLASRLRPEALDDYVGQKHLLGEGKVLKNMLDRDLVSSMIFWGFHCYPYLNENESPRWFL